MPLIDGGISTEKIKITPVVDIPDKYTTASGKYDREWVVIVSAVC
jgi:hypothetical protein